MSIMIDKIRELTKTGRLKKSEECSRKDYMHTLKKSYVLIKSAKKIMEEVAQSGENRAIIGELPDLWSSLSPFPDPVSEKESERLERIAFAPEKILIKYFRFKKFKISVIKIRSEGYSTRYVNRGTHGIVVNW